MDDYKNNKGCRMKGFFEIDRVPGNFHFSSHGYYEEFQNLLQSGLGIFITIFSIFIKESRFKPLNPLILVWRQPINK